jgi:hypothetical protein
MMNTRQREHCFSAPLLHQLWWDHGDSGKGSVLSVGLNRTERDKRLARAALRNHGTSSGLLPTSDQTHDGENLRRIRFPKELADHG